MIFNEESNYNIDVSTSWSTKARIADNAMVNCKLPKTLNLPNVGCCCNHKLNLDIEEWAKEDVQLGWAIKSVGDTMKGAKMSLKNAAILSNLATLKTIIYNKTQWWSGKFDTLSYFVRIHDDLIEAAVAHEDSDMYVNCSATFLMQVKKFIKPMSKLNEIARKMQERCCLVIFCDGPLSPAPDKHFELGIVKIQRNQVANMTKAEKQACFFTIDN